MYVDKHTKRYVENASFKNVYHCYLYYIFSNSLVKY